MTKIEKWVHEQGSVTKAARKLGVTRQSVYCYLWGTRRPSPKTLSKLNKLIKN